MDALEALFRPITSILNRNIAEMTPARELCERLEGKTVAVQGVGHVGYYLLKHLKDEGANMIIADIDADKVSVTAYLLEPAPDELTLRLSFENGNVSPAEVRHTVPRGAEQVTFDVPLPGARRWSLDDPFLYDVEATLEEEERNTLFQLKVLAQRA